MGVTTEVTAAQTPTTDGWIGSSLRARSRNATETANAAPNRGRGQEGRRRDGLGREGAGRAEAAEEGDFNETDVSGRTNRERCCLDKLQGGSKEGR